MKKTGGTGEYENVEKSSLILQQWINPMNAMKEVSGGQCQVSECVTMVNSWSWLSSVN